MEQIKKTGKRFSITVYDFIAYSLILGVGYLFSGWLIEFLEFPNDIIKMATNVYNNVPFKDIEFIKFYFFSLFLLIVFGGVLIFYFGIIILSILLMLSLLIMIMTLLGENNLLVKIFENTHESVNSSFNILIFPIMIIIEYNITVIIFLTFIFIMVSHFVFALHFYDGSKINILDSSIADIKINKILSLIVIDSLYIYSCFKFYQYCKKEYKAYINRYN
jgi:hypothetical protein